MNYKLLLTILSLILLCNQFRISAQNRNDSSITKKSNYQRMEFNPSANPFNDLREAILKAKNENKRIILDVGGKWCIWCHRIDNFIYENSEILNFLNKHFIMVKINYSPENKNEKFLSQYPEIKGYPHFFVLDSDGKLLHSQDTGLLEEGKSYSKEKFITFLRKWAKF